MFLLTFHLKARVFKFCEIKGDHITGAVICFIKMTAEAPVRHSRKVIKYGFVHVCIFVYFTWGHLCICVVSVCRGLGFSEFQQERQTWCSKILPEHRQLMMTIWILIRWSLPRQPGQTSWGSHLSNRCHMILMYRGAPPLTWQPREINHHPSITFFWQICSHWPGSRANGLQSISVKDTAPINYSVTCAPMLWCYLTIFTVLQEAALPLAHCPWSGELLFAWAIIPSAPLLLQEGKRQAAFIAYQEARRSLELHECKHDWRLMKGSHCV